MRVLGIDPGYDRCGVCVLEKTGTTEIVVFSDCIRTDASMPFEERLFIIGSAIDSLIAAHAPDYIASENLFFNTNQKTAINVAGVRGMIAYLSQAHNLPFREFTPLQIKNAVTGYGKSDKQQMISMIEKLVSLESRKRVDDEYDAIGVAITCAASERVFHNLP